MDAKLAITQLQAWVAQVVVKYNLCPFARREVESNSIRYVAAEGPTEHLLQQLLDECLLLQQQPSVATTLIALPRGYEGFFDYLDLLNIAEQLLEAEGFTGEFQLASFHPDYCFADSPQHDAANFTNRAPVPALHILREAQLEQALAEYDEPESIPDRNIAFARRKGAEFFVQLLAHITSSAAAPNKPNNPH